MFLFKMTTLLTISLSLSLSLSVAHPLYYYCTKRRCFKALGFDEYYESYGDGLQILRYNVTTAYTTHLDWIEDKVS